MTEHPLRVWRRAGEQAKGFGGLEHGHASAIEGATAEAACGLQQRCVQREVHDLRDPEVGAQPFDRERQAWVVRHAGRCSMDEALGVRHGGFEIVDGEGPFRPEAAAQIARELPSACSIGIEHPQNARAERENRVRDRGTRAARTEQHHAIEVGAGKSAPEARGEARPVGVVSDPSAIAQQDCIDRAQRSRILRQFAQ